MVKSEEEIKLIEKSAAMVNAEMNAALKAIKPGRKEYEVMADIYHAVLLASSEAQLPGFASASPRTLCTMRMADTWTRTIRDGDIYAIMIECSGLGGILYRSRTTHLCRQNP